MTKTACAAVLALALGLTGCVSLGTYRSLQGQNSGLQKRDDDLKQQDDDLRSQLQEIRREATGLQAGLGAADKSNTDLASQKSQLEKEKADLLAAQAGLKAKTAELEQADTELAAKSDTLRAQNEALLKDAQAKQAQYDAVTGDLKKEISAGQLKITQFKNMLTLDVADQILFDSGKAALKPKGMAVLRKVAGALAHSDKFIRVVGHTDNIPLGPRAAYANNWDLSTARATTVVRFLQERCHLDPARLVAEGRGQWDPAFPNDSVANRRKNRRIAITLIDRDLVDGVSSAVSAAAVPAATASQAP